MATYRKRLFVEIRNGLGWFPNWPLQQNLQLGMIGYYDGWEKNFEWRTSLSQLGISVQPAGTQGVLDEMYATEAAVSTKFEIEQSSNKPVASFAFSKRHSVVAQCHDSGHTSLPINQLQKLLIDKVTSGEIQWDKNWVILTELFRAKGFSTLISGSSKSSSSLSVGIPRTNPVFNIADPTLKIGVRSSEFMAYQAVCNQNTTPYFYVHKLTFPLLGNVPSGLRRYRGMAPKFTNA